MKIGDNGEVWEGEKFTGIRLDGNRLAAVQQIPLARNLMHRLRGFLATSGAKVFNMTRRFDGGYLQVSSYNGFESAYIFSEDNQPEELIDEGILPQIFSGITKDSDIIEIEDPDNPFSTVEALRDFKPTDQTWKHIYKKDPDKPTTSFNNEPRLAVRVDLPIHQYFADPKTAKTRDGDPILDENIAQTKEICGSMYSGLMAKAVQVIMGYGKLQSASASEEHRIDGVKVKYDWRWARCHGIVRGADGLWLVEISATNGVIAMPLPVFKNTTIGTPLHAQMLSSKQDVLRETVKLFRGLPSGGTFPANINQAILDGDVIRLASVAQMQPYFTKSNYSSWMGWSFNLGGAGIPSEAHNTCYKITGSGTSVKVTSYHYKLAFNIGAKKSNRAANEPIATGTASLSEVSNGRIMAMSGWSYYEFANCSFHDGERKYRQEVLSGSYKYVYASGLPYEFQLAPYSAYFGGPLIYPNGYDQLSKTTIFVCHINNTLEKIELDYKKELAHDGITPVQDGLGSNMYGGIGLGGLAGYVEPNGAFIRSKVPLFYLASSYCKDMPVAFEKGAVNRTYISVPNTPYPPETVLQSEVGYYKIWGYEQVVGWSGYSRDAFVIKGKADFECNFNNSQQTTSPFDGIQNFTASIKNKPYLKFVTSASKKTDAEDSFTRFEYDSSLWETSNRHADGLNVPVARPYFQHTAYSPFTNAERGDDYYYVIKHSVHGKTKSEICVAPILGVEISMPGLSPTPTGDKTDEILCKGALLATETTPANANYSFVGYIK